MKKAILWVLSWIVLVTIIYYSPIGSPQKYQQTEKNNKERNLSSTNNVTLNVYSITKETTSSQSYIDFFVTPFTDNSSYFIFQQAK